MRQINWAVVSQPSGVIALSKWMNEIHHWALGVYRQALTEDLKVVLRSDDDLDVSGSEAVDEAMDVSALEAM